MGYRISVTKVIVRKGTMHTTDLKRLNTGYVGSFSAMASPCEILIETDDESVAQKALRLVSTEAWRIEAKYSRYSTDNIIHQIHSAQGLPVKANEELAGLLDFASNCYALSDGLFDITSGVLRKIWRFDGGHAIPSQKQISELLPLIGWNKVKWDSPYITLPIDMQIDLGGIGKEYAVDRSAILVKQNIPDVAFMINFGGDLYANKPPTGKNYWQIGVESAKKSGISDVVQLKVGGVATSGDANRYLIKSGIRYSHVLNPKTGWPVKDAPRSVSVLANTCVEAGFLTTMAMLHGEEAEHFLDMQGVMYWVEYASGSISTALPPATS